MGSDCFNDIEFFRNAFLLVPACETERYRTVLIPSGSPQIKDRLFCSCSKGKSPDCAHAKRLLDLYSRYSESAEHVSADCLFQNSAFRRIFRVFFSERHIPLRDMEIVHTGSCDDLLVRRGKELLVAYHSRGSDRDRLVERLQPEKPFGGHGS